MKKIEQEKNRPASNIPYQGVNKPFRTQFIVPGPGITIVQDANGVCYISAEGGAGVADLVAGDNIELTKTDDGKIVISAVDKATDIAAGQNITIDIDPETGTAVINSITGSATNEHYQGVFDTDEDLIAFDTDPEIGDYGMIKQITYSDGGETTWNGQYKYCFYINGQWTVVDQMLTFTDDVNLLQQFYSVGGSSPVIYLHKIALTGRFGDLLDVPIVATPKLTVEGTTLTATCDTEGAEIWYTTDGTMPHVNGNKYTGPITVTEATTFRFVGIKNGMINSLEATVGVDYQLQPPTIDLDWHDGTITMANPNQSGTIYYTTDGSTPTNASNAYAGPFVITERTRFKLAVINDSLTSDIVDQTYRKLKVMGGVRNLNPATGKINVSPGRIGNDGNVPIDNGILKYTKGGSNPTFSSDDFVNAVSLDNYGGIKTIKEKAFAEGYIPSEVRTSDFGAVKPVSPPVIFDAETNTVSLCNTNVPASNGMAAHGLVDGLFGGPQGYVFYYPQGSTYSRIYYTLDGSTPTANSTLYTGPFQISGNVTVKAVLIAYGQYYSDVVTESIELISEPEISLDSDTGFISISGPSGSTIYYTIDGSTPTTESTEYSAAFDVTNRESVTVKAICVKDGFESAVAEVTYPGLLTKWSGTSGGETDYRVGTISRTPRRAMDGASVFYAVRAGGGYPSLADWIPYSGTEIRIPLFDENNPKEFFFRQTKPGYIPGYYGGTRVGYTTPDAPVIDYDEDTGMATLSLDGNTSQIPLQTNENVPQIGARIYYTLDGSTPTAQNGTLYKRESFAVPEGTTAIKAVTVCYSRFASEVTTEEISVGGGTYGVRFAKNSDSEDGTRVGDMTLHASLPIQSGMKRCLLLDDGTVNYYLDPDDSTKKADGTAADLSGADGQYMVEIPEFYAALLETDDYVEFSVSTDPVEGYFHYPTMYVSADEACLDHATGKLAAVVNNTANYRGGSNDDSKDADPYLTLLQRPVSNISFQEFLDAAQLRGSGWCNYMNMVNSALYFLFITEYATRNSQKAYNPALTAEGYRQGGLGPDVTEFYEWETLSYEPFIPTGFTASLGNNTGVKDYTVQWDEEGVTKTHTAHVSSYRGVSVPIGHLSKAASGYFLRATSAEDVYAYFRDDPDTMSYEPVAGDISVRVPLSIQGQLVSKLGFAGGNLYPAEGTGDPVSDPTQPLTTYYCDGAYVLGSDMASEIHDPESPASSVPVLGGGAGRGSSCGFAFAFIVSDPSFASPFLGTRLCFITK